MSALDVTLFDMCPPDEVMLSIATSECSVVVILPPEDEYASNVPPARAVCAIDPVASVPVSRTLAHVRL
jgi:hypothetical protein